LLTPAEPNVSLVNEDYPAECIKWRSLLSVTHSRFRVNGTQAAPEVEDPPVDRSPDGYLQLKPSRKQAQCTPDSSQNGSRPEPALPVNNICEPQENSNGAEKVSGPQVDRERDALDDLMEDVKAVKDLVGLSDLS